MSIFLLCYGPPRGDCITAGFSQPLLAKFDALCLVTYTYDESGTPARFTSIRVEDPGAYPVAEMLPDGRRYESTSNSMRQFTQIGEGLKALRQLGGNDDDLVVLLRRDLSILSESIFEDFLTESINRIRQQDALEVRLTTNSINPFSFTGHGLHGSDWVIICSLSRLSEKLSIDPKRFAIGDYSVWERMRKGPFCYGAFAAEELFSVAHHPGQEDAQGVGRMPNSVRVPFREKCRFLHETRFVAPARAGITLKKWQYLHCLKASVDHPFGPGLKARVKSLLVLVSFSTELVPPSGSCFWGFVALKAMLSWMIQIPRQIILVYQGRSQG